MRLPPRPISIWQPRFQNGELLFVRPEPHPLGDHYATTRMIRAEKPAGVRRLCFFGESVAAGYGFAPHLTPARVLAHQLAAKAGHGAYEVVDLARTNESLAGLRGTVEAALQLSPDLLVLFAGNNWNLLETPHISPYAEAPSARHVIGEQLLEEGLWGPINRAARERLERVSATLASIHALATRASIPVVLVIPEVNLLDWETRQPVSWLATTEVMRWYSLYHEAERALRDGQWELAVASAHQMLDLDDGTCPTGYRLLTRARLGQGRADEAHAAARAEVDTVYYPALCFLAAPQVTTFDQELLRRLGGAWDWDLVDLPLLFSSDLEVAGPDRRLFLDYCHLTEEGIRLAMAAVTQAVLRRFQSCDASDTAVFDASAFPLPPLTAEQRATAYLGTAIHSAHRLVAGGDRKGKLLDYWCSAALDAAPAVEGAMRDLVEARVTSLPALLTRAQRRNLDSAFRLQFQHGWEYEFLDAAILLAVERVLSRRERREGSGEDALWRPTQGDMPRHPGISDPFYLLEEPLEQAYPDLLPHDGRNERAYFRAAWPRTTFALIVDPTVSHCLDVTLRLPVLPGQTSRPPQPVSLRLNGQSFGTIRAGSRWLRTQLALPARLLQQQFNRLTIHWPPLPDVDAALPQTIIERLRRGEEVDLHPIFGEVYEFAIRTTS